MNKRITQNIYFTLMFCILSTSYSYANPLDMSYISQEIYATKQQRKILLAKYKIEREKYFNNRTVNSYIKAMNQLRNREIELINKKNYFILENNRLIKVKHQERIVRQQKQRLKRTARKKEARKKQQTIQVSREKIAQMRGNIIVKIDLSEQKMNVYKGKNLLYTWSVSTARKGYVTPKGNYKPYHLAKMHYSTIYDNSPMPYSIFFKGGYAIHGTNSTRRLGRRASHGCVRLHTNNAKKLYHLIQNHGYKRTSIKIRA